MQTALVNGVPRRARSDIRVCRRCLMRFDWRRSSSSLKLTYCGILCEAGDLGFTIEGLLRATRRIPDSIDSFLNDLKRDGRQLVLTA
jgi:hypothetical protein